jgi:hypothetical protein
VVALVSLVKLGNRLSLMHVEEGWQLIKVFADMVMSMEDDARKEGREIIWDTFSIETDDWEDEITNFWNTTHKIKHRELRMKTFAVDSPVNKEKS